MNQNDAKKLIQDTFENSFDKIRFAKFVRNIFKDKLDNSTFDYHGAYIPEAFREYIVQYERIGKYADADNSTMDVLIVKLKKGTTVANARSAQRNFIKRYLSGKGRDAAIVAFYSENSVDWRFSFIKMEYSIQQKKDEFTPAKRFSFLVGKDEKSHTAQKQLLPLIISDKSPKVTEVENCFNIEVVTKEFFNKYFELYKKLSEELEFVINNDELIQKDFEKHNINNDNFTKKLLGQIVFLYFLQKKGWLGVPHNEPWGNGNKHFMRSLFEKCVNEGRNFYNDYLEYLFYEALAEPNRNSADPSFYPRFNCKIPFLNGGLFEPINGYDWQNTNITLRNEIFSNTSKTPEGDTGTGILDIFDRYNFTIKEDEPLEKEVAVDPEMLGKVFENLLESKERKSKGAFYTPREIVHYMCQESLVYYIQSKFSENESAFELVPSIEDIQLLIQKGANIIETEAIAINKNNGNSTYQIHLPESITKNAVFIDKALENVKICDPAIGSGAFPVGMLTEIVKAREVLSIFLENSPLKRGDKGVCYSTYQLKRHCIQESLYGVDIDESAVDIAKLRLWLSLVVDENDFETIKPLPNLDYKIVCGNSLIGLPENALLSLDLEKEIEELKNEYFNLSDNFRKQSLKGMINEKQKILLSNASKFLNYDVKFDFRLHFSEVFTNNGGFDVVIGNPPYVGVKGNHKLFDDIKKGNLSKFVKGRAELFYYFLHLGIIIGNDNCINAFITTNYFITASDAGILRKTLHDETTVLKFLNFNELKLFTSAQGQHNMISIFKNGKNINTKVMSLITNKKGISSDNILQDILYNNDKNTLYFMNNQEELFEGSSYYIRIGGKSAGSNDLETIFKKLQNNSKLGDICTVRQGLRTGIDKITNSHIEKFNFDGIQGKGVFILNLEDLEEYGICKTNKLLRPLFKNSDIFKYTTKIISDKFVLYIDHKISLEFIEKENTVIYNHLLKFKDLIQKIRILNNEDISIWYCLDRPREEWLFEGEKIIAPQRSKINTFGYNNVAWYSSADVYFIKQDSKKFKLKYILSLLNSKVYFIWLFHKGKRKGEMLELYQQPLSEIPIKEISLPEQQPFIDLVDIILKKKEQGEVTTAEEKQIDLMVYKLYELTYEEVKVVEPEFAMSREEYEKYEVEG